MIARSFFQRDPISCSRELIGCELVWNGCSGIVVETEAYSAVDDEASHVFFRPSARRFVAEHPPGTAYVYLNYGVHWLFNVLVKGGAEDGFVLFRALEPKEGIAEMQARRPLSPPAKLCAGPGRLTLALGITGADHGCDLCRGPNGFRATRLRPEIVTDLRVGITRSAHLPWRFLLAGSRAVSVPAPLKSKMAKPVRTSLAS